MKKPDPKNSNGSGRENRLADYDLWVSHRVKRYPDAKRCPKCRTVNKRRRSDGVCFGCVAKVKAGQSEYVDDGSDCLDFDNDMRVAIAALPPRVRNEDRKDEYLPREYATDTRCGMCFLREV